MVRWALITVIAFLAATPTALAASPYTRVSLAECDRELREATFQARMTTVRRATRMQMRFTLQVLRPGERRFKRVAAPGFGTWITVPPGYGKYTYDKTVKALLPPASYRAVVHFRWRDARGRTIRTEQATTPACRLPDVRPDLVVRALRIIDGSRYVATVVNRGREAAGPFSVEFLRDAEVLASAEILGLAAHGSTTVVVPGLPCTRGDRIEAVVDPGGDVDESNEENGTLAITC
jgi:hypothetical protein